MCTYIEICINIIIMIIIIIISSYCVYIYIYTHTHIHVDFYLETDDDTVCRCWRWHCCSWPVNVFSSVFVELVFAPFLMTDMFDNTVPDTRIEMSLSLSYPSVHAWRSYRCCCCVIHIHSNHRRRRQSDTVWGYPLLLLRAGPRNETTNHFLDQNPWHQTNNQT